MALVVAWTGSSACALQAALRLSNESFARHLGVAVRTVGTWHQKPELVPKAEMQQLLDTALERSSESAKTRFAKFLEAIRPDDSSALSGSGVAQTLQVAIAIVLDDRQVLLVQRRGNDGKGISWQFPAGVIKPGVSADITAVRECLAETGIHCKVTRSLGNRIHPITDVLCRYLLCEYLGGTAENRDEVENVSVAWAPTDKLARFISAEHIYRPVLEALEVLPR